MLQRIKYAWLRVLYTVIGSKGRNGSQMVTKLEEYKTLVENSRKSVITLKILLKIHFDLIRLWLVLTRFRTFLVRRSNLQPTTRDMISVSASTK